MLLDGPQAYARELHEPGSVNIARDGRTKHAAPEFGDSRPRPYSSNHEGDKAKHHSMTTEDHSGWRYYSPVCHRLMGDALWRQQLLQRVGWIVVRVHWKDWSEADRAPADGEGKERLLRRLMSESGLISH